MSPEFKFAFRKTLPVLFAYLPLGAAFGLLFGTLGYPWYFAGVSALIVYAGAAQFLAVGLLAAHASLTEIFLATLFLNIRHIFYGFSFMDRFKSWGRSRYYLIYALSDETYSILSSNSFDDPEADRRFCRNITVLNQIYWVTGCTLGGALQADFSIPTNGFEFVLTALFTVMTIEQALDKRHPLPFVLAGIGALLALVWQPAQMLLISLSVVFMGLAASFRRLGIR